MKQPGAEAGMNRPVDWLEEQYWSDVMVIRPQQRIEQQQAQSEAVRESSELIDRPYGDHERQRLDLFLPDGNGPFSLLVFVHGGYWQLGHKNDWAFLAPGWQQRGVAFATVGYRLAPEVTVDTIVQDVQSALDKLNEQHSRWELDPQRIVVAGISAGAQLAAMTTVFGAKRLGRAAVLLSGVYDLAPLTGTTPGKAIGAQSAQALGPLTLAPRSDCPACVAYGGAETQVFQSQSQALAAHLTNHGSPTQAQELPGANHFTVVDALRAEASSVVSSFISEQLGV